MIKTIVYDIAVLAFAVIAILTTSAFFLFLGVIEFISLNLAPLSAMLAAYLMVKFLGI